MYVALPFFRHETFHPRFGWLKKGVDAAVHDSEFSGKMHQFV